jgi:hypothetical protein
MVIGGKIKSSIGSERTWLLGDSPLRESDTWKNLGKLWHADPDPCNSEQRF